MYVTVIECYCNLIPYFLDIESATEVRLRRRRNDQGKADPSWPLTLDKGEVPPSLVLRKKPFEKRAWFRSLQSAFNPRLPWMTHAATNHPLMHNGRPALSCGTDGRRYVSTRASINGQQTA